jgi:uncharacterized membrane protein
MGSLLTLLLPALVPAFADGVKNVIGRLTGGAAVPQSADDQVKLTNSETERLKALAALDAPGGTVSPWVANFRASFRYFAVSAIVLATIAALFVGDLGAGALAALLDLCGASMSFIIGERMYLKLSR